MRFVRTVPWHRPVLPFARQRAAPVPHSTLPAAASSGKARRKPRDCQGATRSIGFRSGKRRFFGAAWHYEDGKGFSLQLDLLPARLFPATSTGPKTSCSLLSSCNGNHAAGFVG